MSALVALSEGTTFASDYRIEAPLSSGGMGAVYVVEQLSTGKRRALKVMHPQLVSNADLRKRFEREARIGARIDSEHVVEVHAAGVDAATGTPYIIMELLRGAELSKRMRGSPLTRDEVRAIFEQLCHAVGAAHTAGVVHRDLKPENVFLAQSRLSNASVVVKVLDFGIAKLSAEAGTSTAAMGSPLWMPPEQTERTTITAAADVWALGLIAFYMLTGRLFWRAAEHEDPSVQQLMREIIIDPIPTASARASELGVVGLLPPNFDRWFSRCVSRNVAERFPNANEAWAAFSQCLAGGGAAPYEYPRSTVPAGPLGLTPTGPIVQNAPVPSSGTEIPPTEPAPSPSAPQMTPAPLAATPPPIATKPASNVGVIVGVALAAVVVLGIGGAVVAKRVLARTPREVPQQQPSAQLASPTPQALDADVVLEALTFDASTDLATDSGIAALDGGPDKPKVVLPKQPNGTVAFNAVNALLPRAQTCLTYGTASAEITFKSDGSVKDVWVSGVDVYTRTCVKNALMKAHVPPFSDPTYTMTQVVRPQ